MFGRLATSAAILAMVLKGKERSIPLARATRLFCGTSSHVFSSLFTGEVPTMEVIVPLPQQASGDKTQKLSLWENESIGS